MIVVQENLSMIGKIKQREQIDLKDLLMIGKINILTVGKEVLVVLVTILMINFLTRNKIKEKKNQSIVSFATVWFSVQATAPTCRTSMRG